MNGLIETLVRTPRIGEILSLVSAFVWALSVVLFRVVGDKVHPLGMNAFKNFVGLALFALTLAAFGSPFVPALPWTRYAVFFLSGTLGIALSDWLFFAALVKLGAELTAIVDCAYSPFVIGLSFLFLGERMSAFQTTGVGMIVAAVLMITRGKNNGQLSRRDLVGGVVLGIVAMLLTAAGIVLVKPYLKETSLLWACFSRMAGGAVSTSLLLAGHPRRRTIVAPLRSGAKRGLLVFASILAAYFSQFFWLGGMKYTQASTASALNQVNTIFIFLLAALFLKEKITPLKLVAVGLAFGGAILVSAPF